MALLLTLPAAVFSIDISVNGKARLDIVSRTSFGIDMDHPWVFGLDNELTQVDLVFGLAPWQELSNRVNTQDAYGFINITLQSLSLIRYDREVGYIDTGSSTRPANIFTDAYQTTAFMAGIARGPWLVQLNAGANEPFFEPWFKGMEYINDGFKFSWAYLDSMADIRRINAISGIPVITKRGEENIKWPKKAADNDSMRQFGFKDSVNVADRFGPDISGEMVAAMYNADSFGLNFKLGTEHKLTSKEITKANYNGIAIGIDSVFLPYFAPGLKIFASLVGTYNYDIDTKPDPIIGGTRIGYNIPLSPVISVEPWVGLDMGSKIKDKGGLEKPEYEASFGGTMRWPGQGGWAKDYILNTEGRVYPGMSVGYKIYENLETKPGMEHSIKFTLFEPRGDDGMFFKIGSEIIVDIIDMTNVTFGIAPLDLGMDPFFNPKQGFSVLATAYFDYEIKNIGKLPGIFLPWTILYYDNLTGADKNADRINDFKIDLGINWEGAIRNTTFGLVWNSGSLIQKKAVTTNWDQAGNYVAGFLRLFVEIRL